MHWLDNARIIATFAVVVLHVSAGIVLKSPVGSEVWWAGNIVDSAVRWCIPVFVMISGALLLDPDRKEGMRGFYRKRASRILVPLIAWTAIYLLRTLLRDMQDGAGPSLFGLAKSVLLGKPYYHLWFLYMIAGLYLFTPYLRKAVEKATRSQLAFLVCACFAVAALSSLGQLLNPGRSLLFTDMFPAYIPYYFLGYYVRTALSSRTRGALLLGFALTAALTSLGCFLGTRESSLDAGLYFYDYLSVTVIPMSACAFLLLKQIRGPMLGGRLTPKVSSLTLGVYLLHPLAIEGLGVVNVDVWRLSPAISIPLISLAVFVVSLIAASLIAKVPHLRRVI